jgi:hypothetical protein
VLPSVHRLSTHGPRSNGDVNGRRSQRFDDADARPSDRRTPPGEPARDRESEIELMRSSSGKLCGLDARSGHRMMQPFTLPLEGEIDEPESSATAAPATL